LRVISLKCLRGNESILELANSVSNLIS
jgi:hypothetical protein